MKGAARIAIARQQLTDRLGSGAGGLDVIPMGGADWTRAVVCSRKDLQSWCETEAARDARCVAVLPDMLTLPSAEETLVAEVRGDRLLARGGLDDGLAAPISLAAPLMDRLIAGNALTRVHVAGDVSNDLQGLFDRFDLEPAAPPNGPTRPAIDLRDALAASDSTGLWLWGAAAGFAFVAFGLWAAGIWLETRNLRDNAAQVRAETVAVLREGLIPNAPILDIRQQVAQAMTRQSGESRSSAGSAVDLLSRATIALFGTGLEVRTISYERAANALDIDVSAGTFADVDALVASLDGSGLEAVATGMRNGPDGGVVAQLRMTFQEVTQ
ncbi:type II secretion system protein GspL [Roseivivax lentus]|uniref:type II secretion system protein GspL n=1 Tax=Roseivivax lentus TaxID=633194 RepID=UPI0013567231|nr:type II secretion system protein GspL [Roseivivax lentus]